ncbi:MAG: MotB family protein [Rhizobiaceae bacterium]|nr:MotB family protein [Rhizobiaceae bacterium]
MTDAQGHHHEIIIVRHGGGDHEDGHHGGVWKIAFADFMTAMMCFFLVMWLINAANEQTKAAVASYFNPVKLIDRNSSRKGLEDIGDGPNAVGTEADNPQAPDSKAGTYGRANAGPEKKRSSDEAVKDLDYSDQYLFADPYAVLAEIVADTGAKANMSEKGEGGASEAGPATGASGGESYRDPFAPDFWTQPDDVADPSNPMAGAPKPETAAPAGPDPVEAMIQADAEGATKMEEVIAVVQGDKTEDPGRAPTGEAKTGEAKPGEAPAGEAKAGEAKAGEAKSGDATAGEAKAGEAKSGEAKAGEAKTGDADKPAGGPSDAAIEEAKQIKRELAEALGKGGTLDDGITVVPTDNGVTISVTEEFDFGMFELGSAVPHRELVLAMEKIAKVIGTRTGNVTINGHTDARPFRNRNYDNWRLSTARAHSAYYMLARAGLDEKRMVEVAGFADRRLKNKEDPFSATNRRIEILLEVGG